MMIEVVGNGQIKRLIEIAEPFCRPGQNRRGQDRENKQAENDPRAAIEQTTPHGAEGAIGNRERLGPVAKSSCRGDMVVLPQEYRSSDRVPFMFGVGRDRVFPSPPDRPQ